MRELKIIFHFIILFVLVIPLNAQQNNTLYFMSEVAQSALLNPAYTSDCNYLGLPVISSFHFDYGNTAFAYNQLFPPTSAPRIPDLNFLDNRLHNLDLISFQLHTDILSVGFWFRDYYFSFRMTEKVNTILHFEKDLFNLVWEGNTQYVGEEVEISRIGGNFNYYREYSLSAATRLNEYLQIGFRPKFLFGKLNLNTRKELLSIYTDSEKYDLDIQGSYLINSSLPISVEQNPEGKSLSVTANDMDVVSILLNRKNPGFATDLGAVYHYSDNLRFYGSLIDLGFIRWASSPNNVEAEQDFQFEGLSESDFQSDNYVEGMIDSITNSWSLHTSRDNYFTFLPLKIYAGGTYNLSERMNLGILNRNMLFRSRVFPSLTLSYNATFFNFLTVSASYSYNNYSFNNLGAGFSLQSKSVQFYMVTDNLLALKPLNTRNLNMRFGFNIFINCREGEKAGADRRPKGGGANCFWIERRLSKDIIPKK